MEQTGMATDTLTLLYGAAAAHCRGDKQALSVLTDNTLPGRVLWEGVIVTAAHTLRNQGWDREVVSHFPLGENSELTDAVLSAAEAWNVRDRESVHLAVIGLAKSKHNPVLVGGLILGSLWTVAAEELGLDPIDYTKRLCLAAGMVIATN